MSVNFTVEKATGELHKAFELLNTHIFSGELETPALIIQTRGNRMAYGWITIGKIWTDREKQTAKREITISAEFLNRPPTEVLATLLHEMCHLYNLQHNIQDTSRGNTYHNAKFRETAEKFGLEVEHHPTAGHAITRLNETTQAFIEEYFDLDAEAFSLARLETGLRIPPTPTEKEPNEKQPTGESKKSHNKKWNCPKCKQSIRATKQVNLICGECLVKLVEC